MIRLKRNTGLMGAGSRISVHVDDEKAATIKQNKQIELDLPNSEARISVSQLGVHSNELVVNSGQVIEITTKRWNHIGLILVLVIVALLSIFLPPVHRVVASILIVIIYLSIYRFVDGFELKTVYPPAN